MTAATFERSFQTLTGHPPFPWQRALYDRFLDGAVPAFCDIPTGLGKTSVVAVWLLARSAGARVPRRLVYVVNRRTVVDQTTVEVERIRARLQEAGITEPLAISTLRGQMADNRAWSEDPSRPAVISGTVDMIGSRLLFSGYRIGFKTRPLHAGFLGQDALLVHDEAHLEPAFQALIQSIVKEQRRSGDPWPLRIMALTATPPPQLSHPPGENDTLRLSDKDRASPEVARRIGARKQLSLHLHRDGELVDRIVEQVLTYEGSGAAVIVFLRTVDDVASTRARLEKAGMPGCMFGRNGGPYFDERR
jgi:CRISPR-associated endonuclease/helicase Cas3